MFVGKLTIVVLQLSNIVVSSLCFFHRLIILQNISMA